MAIKWTSPLVLWFGILLIVIGMLNVTLRLFLLSNTNFLTDVLTILPGVSILIGYFIEKRRAEQ